MKMHWLSQTSPMYLLALNFVSLFYQVSVPNIYHAFQTAERIREKHPDKGKTTIDLNHGAAILSFLPFKSM